MSEFVRVRWKATGHQSTIASHRVDERHAVLKRPAVDRNGDLIPPKYKTTVASPASAQPIEGGHRATESEGDI